MAFWSWSKTAGNNSTADSTINWAEGQSPSSVNDSARAMMARTAEWRDDVSGTITTGGTSTAYTVTSNQTFDSFAHMAGAMIAFVPHTTNTGGGGAPVTLNVDSLGAKSIRFAPNKDLQSGVLVQGTPYVVTYNNVDGAFYLQGFPGDPYGVPVGGFMPYVTLGAPSSAFVNPYGQALSRSVYSSLFALCTTFYGSGDGSTTFNIPDLRGRTPIGSDDMGGVAAGRVSGAGIGATGGAQSVTIAQNQLPNVSPTFTGNALPPHSHTVNATGISVSYSGSGGNNSPTFGSTATSSDSAGTPSGTISSINGNVTQQATSVLQPYIALHWLLRAI